MSGKFSTYKVLCAGVLVLLLVAWICARLLFNTGVNSQLEPSAITVERRSFSLQVVDRGLVSPARISPISSQISSNQAKIVWLVKEGTHVTKGMLVARFDTKPFMDSLHKAEQAHADARATFQAAQKLLSLQKEEEAGKIEEAERKVEIAGIEANNIKNGSGPLKRKILEQKLHQAERALEISQSEVDDLGVLFEKGHVSIREREKAEDKVATAKEQVAVAIAELDNFKTYVWPKLQREAELLVNGAESNFERVKRTAELQIQNRAAEVEKYRRNEVNKLTALASAKTDIVNCDIYSPTDGILLYSELPRENRHRKIQIGDSVWVGQTFLKVPDTTELIAEIQVREVDVAKISEGMKAEIEIDAFPGKVFHGLVDSVASLAEQDEENSNIRRFYTRIRFVGETDKIHVGMSVTTKTIYQELQDVVAVPISSLIYREGKSMVQAKKGDLEVEIPLVLGARGVLWAEVLDGVDVGDVIYREPN
jgi:HlyD family secretion protein